MLGPVPTRRIILMSIPSTVVEFLIYIIPTLVWNSNQVGCIIKYTEKNMPYSRAPIIEAIFDIQTALPDTFKVEQFDLWYERLKKNYPEKQIRREISASFTANPGNEPRVEHSDKPIGHILRNEEHGKVVQATMSGFTFSKLAPYTDWETFSAEAFALWQDYTKLTHPIGISRVALRYVNRIELPRTMKNFQEYITTVPEIAEGLPHSLTEMFMRIVIPNIEKQITAIVTETIDAPNATNKSVPLIFDIDVFKNIDLASNSQDIYSIFADLREYKNAIFEKSLTEKAKEGFK